MEQSQVSLSEELELYVDLYDNEKVLKILNRHPNSYFMPRILRSFIFWLFYGPLWLFVQGILVKTYANKIITAWIFGVIAGIWGLIFIISMAVGKLFVKGHKYVITSSRIVLFRKFIGISFREIEYKRITDLVLYKSVFGRIWNFGNLLPVTAGVEMGAGKMGRFSIEGVKDVFAIRTLLLEQIRRIQKQILAEYQQKALDEQKSDQM